MIDLLNYFIDSIIPSLLLIEAFVFLMGVLLAWGSILLFKFILNRGRKL